jgi:hypothetical protein
MKSRERRRSEGEARSLGLREVSVSGEISVVPRVLGIGCLYNYNMVMH